MWQAQPGSWVIELGRELGLGLAFVLLLGLYAAAAGLVVPGAWAVLLGAVLLRLATTRPQGIRLFEPLLLLGIALPSALLSGQRLPFLWVLLGTTIVAAVLSGEERGPLITRWLGRVFAGCTAIGVVGAWLFRIPHSTEQRFALAVAISLLAGDHLARGGWLRLLPLFPLLLLGAAIFDRLDWALVAFGVIVAAVVGRRYRASLPLLVLVALLGLRAPSDFSLVIPSATDELLAAPAILVSCFWFGCAAIAALRRSWKEEPKEIVLGSAAVMGLLAAALWVTDRASSPSSLFLAAFAIGLGLAARRPPVGPPSIPAAGESAKATAVLAALATAGAALGATAAPPQGGVTPFLAALFLVLVGLGHLLPWSVAHAIRGPLTFAALAWLVMRPFGAPVAPGSAMWWKSPPALTALFALTAALAGTAHAVRRPGRIGAAQVAGAVASLWLLGLLFLDNPGIAVRGEEPALNVTMGAFSVFMLFIGWAGPLEMGRARPSGAARRLVGLPTVAVAFALGVTAVAGWR